MQGKGASMEYLGMGPGADLQRSHKKKKRRDIDKGCKEKR
jgi:hypothetical protein